MSAVRASALPALVIPPRRSDSPLECSDGVSPHQLAKAGAERCVSSRGFEQKEHRKLSSLSIGSAHAF